MLHGLGFRAFGSFGSGVPPSDAALYGATRQTVLAEPTGALSPAVQPGNHIARKVHHLSLCVDAHSRAGVIDDRGGPCLVERRLRDLILWRRFSEVLIFSIVHKRVVTRDGSLQN